VGRDVRPTTRSRIAPLWKGMVNKNCADGAKTAQTDTPN
jgi:hypothetical protein